MALLTLSQIQDYSNRVKAGESMTRMADEEIGIARDTLSKYIRLFDAGEHDKLVSNRDRVRAIAHRFAGLKLCECVDVFSDEYGIDISNGHMRHLLLTSKIDYFKIGSNYSIITDKKRNEIDSALAGGFFSSFTELGDKYGVSMETVRNRAEKLGVKSNYNHSNNKTFTSRLVFAMLELRRPMTIREIAVAVKMDWKLVNRSIHGMCKYPLKYNLEMVPVEGKNASLWRLVGVEDTRTFTVAGHKRKLKKIRKQSN